jgi:imidazolonepropionase-like amidohydrolase
MQNLRRVAEAGVNIGFGTDAGAQPVRIPGVSEHRELQLMVQAGLTPMQAITIATSKSAAMLHQNDTGTIAVGKTADLLVLDGNPLTQIENTEKILGVWHNGQRVGELATQ